MPIPLLFIAAGAGTALFGVGKGVKAGLIKKKIVIIIRLQNIRLNMQKIK